VTAKQKKLVLFGAGKIGRSFIGQLFSRGGYEVVFIDNFKPVIDELNRRRNYNVVIKAEKESVINIQNVRGIHVDNIKLVKHEVSTASIMAVSVGQNGLKSVIPLIAGGLLERYKFIGATPLDIIIAENIRNGAEFLLQELEKYLPEDFPLNDRVGLIETSIGKMVPIMLQKDAEEDLLQVFAEPYNTLILDELDFKNPIPEIVGLAPKKNMKAWVDRKLFIHNLGHATAAYLGFQKYPSANYIFEVLSDQEIHEATRKTMLQSADILMGLYPEDFTLSQLEEHIDDLLSRFQNKALGDTIFRIGCDLYRKLSPEDRLVAPIQAAISLNKPYDLIFEALVAGISFRATDENGKYFPADEDFFIESEKGIVHILRNVCQLNSEIIKELN